MKMSIFFFLVLLSIFNSHAQTTILTITSPASANYGVGANLDFTVNFSANVNVTGTPRIAMNIGGNLRYANYLSGSGTPSLNFRYSIVSGFGSLTGVGVASPLQLNGGTISDSTPAPAVLTFRNTFYSGIVVNAPVPGIVSINIPSTIPPTYLAGQTAEFTVTFSEPMFASVNTSRLKINVGGVFQSAVLVSGSGTNTFTYRYTVAIGNFDADGLVMLSPLEKSTSTILNANGMAPTLTFVPPDLITMTVDGRVPTVVVNSKPSNGFYTVGDSFNFTLTYSRNVYVTGNPRVPIHVGYPPLEIARYANYIGGSGSNELTFRYIVQTADEDSDGVYFNQWLNMDFGSIVDDVGNSAMFAFWGIKMPNYGYSAATVDGTPTPTISQLNVPTNADYQAGQTLDFTVVYDRPVVIGLVPRLPLTIGSSTVYANYLSGSGTSTLVFRYTVQPGNLDLDGITLASSLSGGSIRDLSMTYNASLTFTPPSTTGIIVDGIDSAISSITPPANKYYILGESLNFIVNFTSAVTVSGFPRLPLNVGGSTLYATYISGSGTSSLTFRYIVGASQVDTDGIATITPIDPNSGSITEASGDSATLTFTAQTYPGVKIDSVAPTISNVLAPASGTYILNNTVEFSVTFSESVMVVGTPRINIVVGSTSRYATYSAANSTSTTLAFIYSVASGDNDNDGIISFSPLQLNGGTITDLAGNALTSLTFTPPNTTGVLVDGTTGITNVTSPGAATYKTGNTLNFVFTYSQKVLVTGTPRLAITAGTQTIYANYFSGNNSTSLTFRYVVASGISDNDGITLLSPINLNGGTITGTTGSTVNYPVPNTSGVLLDGLNVALTSVTPPAGATYGLAQNLIFNLNYNFPAYVTGTPRIQITVGSTTRYATYFSGSGTTSHEFRYLVQSTDVDTDGLTTVGPAVQLNGGSIGDGFGDAATVTFTALNYPNIKVDGVIPSISTVTGPANSTYGLGQSLDFTLNSNEPLMVTGSPQIQVTVGSTTRYATYWSGTGTSTLTFRYTVLAGDYDIDGIVAANTIVLNGGTIKDVGLNDLSTLNFTALNLSAVLVNSLTSIGLVTTPSNGTYTVGNNLDFSLNYSNLINVTGTPRILINVGGSTVYADYFSGSGTSNLIFRYTVLTGQLDLDGIALAGAISLNGGTILDGSGISASLSFTPPNTTGIFINAAATTISSITPPTDGTYGVGLNMDFIVNYTSQAIITGVPRIQLTVGATTLYANYFSGSGSASHIFRYTVGSGQNDTDGITTIGPVILLNGGIIKNPLGSNVLLDFTATSYANKKVETIAPTISNMIVSANGIYAQNETIQFTATFSETVVITGSPRLTLTVGAATQYATYTSGSGTNTIIFQYTVPIGMLDTNGITALTNVDLNGGTIKDLATNTQTNFVFTIPLLTGVTVDSVAPTISSFTPPVNQNYTTGGNLNFTVAFSQVVVVVGSPSLTLLVGTNTKNAVYVSGSGTTSLIFRYTVALGDNDPNGIDRVSPLLLNAGTIKDTQGNNANLTFVNATHAGVRVDALAPSLLSITPPTDNVYKSGGIRPTISFTVSYNEPITVVGAPRIHLTVGSILRYATYTSGSGTANLVFRYNVNATDFDLDGITIENLNEIDLNGGTLRDAVSFNAPRNLGTVNSAGILAVYSIMQNWYDISDTSKLVFNGFNVSGIQDKINGYNLTHNGTGAIYNSSNFNGGSQSFITCNSGNSFQGVSKNSPLAIVAIYRAPMNATNQYLYYLTSDTRPMVRFTSTANGGTVAFGINGRKYSGGVWSTAAATATNLWTAGQVKVSGFAWATSQNLVNSLCKMDGELAEAFFFNTLPTGAQMTTLQTYINNRYGLVFP